ncbi:hypothetical protein CHGG_05681 [Chaetomium globosum CBS 148.51]|uniref:Helicase C-terminal domain-containing protein n=1 Tax=Chaetomium globosum (strain ATCC 6205 / CBS 148.51 / DSM 1962 / NBRC 6347 / NRRL 1970) TaxID=306901 RepID=Q2H6N4_CHAGB|nr:uncharacterized protein CHGG_05681 [Chaetomium globosum CBS 148.51]EAQ89062.1 hypothetical protein CHGG_05681 [Chaetomium globosum CBS 148.51]
MPSVSVKGRRKEAVVKRVEEIDGDSDSGASSASEEASDASEDENDSNDASDASDANDESAAEDSDSLDSASPRKRRRTSPPASDDEKPNIIKSAFNVPSRIKRKPQVKTNLEVTPQPREPEPAPRVTAPLDANTTFESLGLRPWLVQSLANMAIKRAHRHSAREHSRWLLKGRDWHRWEQDRFSELALQIYEQVKAISSPHSLKAILVTGGSDMRSQAIALAQRPHVVIATPGRLADHIRTSGEDTICGLRRNASARSRRPPSAKPFLFTAHHHPRSHGPQEHATTIPAANPSSSAKSTPTPWQSRPPSNRCTSKSPVTHREHYLHMFLLTPANAEKSAIIFCNRTSTADYLHHLLRLLDHRVTALHSRLPQRQRIDNLGRFRASAARILVATDVAARGLDIPEVKLVINYDIPRDPDDYIHRVGRTARAGRKGDAVTFVGQRDVELVLAIEQRVGRQMEAWEEAGVNLETRVVRDALKLVGEKKREALLEVEEHREVGGKRKRGKQKLRLE